jgi:hypothetical protein
MVPALKYRRQICLDIVHPDFQIVEEIFIINLASIMKWTFLMQFSHEQALLLNINGHQKSEFIQKEERVAEKTAVDPIGLRVC